MHGLSSKELETKIENLNSTVLTLKLAHSEVKCDKAKKTIQLQIDTYTSSLRQMLMLLNKRLS